MLRQAAPFAALALVAACHAEATHDRPELRPQIRFLPDAALNSHCAADEPTRRQARHAVPSRLGRGGPPAEGSCSEPADRVDILVVYTELARDNAGGTAAIEALIDTAIFDMNTALADSGVTGSVALADAREIGGPLTTNSATLLRLITETDGSADEIQQWRNETNADLVCFIPHALDVCGRAWIGVGAGNTPLPDFGYSIVSLACIDDGETWTFAHEIGHNLGLYHEWENDVCNAGGSAFGKGFAAPDDSFRTIMATNGTAPRLLRFSDPGVLVNGQAVGAPAGQNRPAHAAAALETAIPVVARYRVADADGNGVCDADEIATDPALDCNGNAVLDALEADWDHSGVADACEIAADPSLDLDADGVPDAVETTRQYVNASAPSGGDGTSWATARNDLGEAMRLAEASGDVRELWLAAGTYKPAAGTTHRAIRFELPPDVSIYGGFAGTETALEQRDVAANPTVLSGDNLGDDTDDTTIRGGDNAIHLLWIWNAGTVTVDGLTFRGAFPNLPVNCGWNYAGGGIFALGTDLTVRNCVFTDNSGTWAPAFHSGNNPSVVIEDTDFIENDAIGDTFWASVPAGTAGAARVFLRNNDTDVGLIRRSRFLGNTTTNGVAALWTVNGRPIVTDSLFSGNRTLTQFGFGSAVTLGFPQHATFVNSTVVGNRSSTTALPVGLNLNGGEGLIANSIFWDNEANTTSFTRNADYYQLYLKQQGAVVDTANLIVMNYRGDTAGTGAATAVSVSAADPVFIEQNGPDGLRGTPDDNPRLTAGSPAIDAGNDALRPTADALDLDRGERFIDDPAADPFGPGAISDLGPYERDAGPQPCSLADVAAPLGVLDIDDVLAFLGAFAISDPLADVAAPAGAFDIDDVLSFLTAFAVGCP